MLVFIATGSYLLPFGIIRLLRRESRDAMQFFLLNLEWLPVYWGLHIVSACAALGGIACVLMPRRTGGSASRFERFAACGLFIAVALLLLWTWVLEPATTRSR